MKNPFTSIFFLLLLLAACEQDFDVFIPDEQPPVQTRVIDRFFDEARPAGHRYQLDATAGGELTLPSWGRFVLPPQALVEEDGDPATGTVDIEIRESLQRGDWLTSRLPGFAGDQLLALAAAVEVRITREERPLRLADGQFIELTLPSAETLSAPLLYAGEESGGRLQSWTEAPGVPAVTGTEVLDEEQDTMLPAFTLQSRHTGWLIMGEPAPSPAVVTDLCVLLPAWATEGNTAVYAVYSQRPSLVPLRWDDGAPDEARFCADDLPAGESLYLLAITADEAGTYAFQQRALELEGAIQLEWMEPQPTNLHDILEFLAGL